MTRNPRTPPKHAEEDVPTQSLDESIGFLLNETSRLSRRLLYGRLASRGIRGGSWYVLRVLWEGDGVTQRELADRLGMTQPSTLEMLRSMERDDLIRFERDSLDKRKTRVYLTTRARDLKVPLLHLAEEATQVVVQRLSQPEQVALRILLRNVRDTTAEALGHESLDNSGAPAPALDLRRETAAAEGNTAQAPGPGKGKGRQRTAP